VHQQGLRPGFESTGDPVVGQRFGEVLLLTKHRDWDSHSEAGLGPGGLGLGGCMLGN